MPQSSIFSAPLRSAQVRGPPDLVRSPLRFGRCNSEVPRTSCVLRSAPVGASPRSPGPRAPSRALFIFKKPKNLSCMKSVAITNKYILTIMWYHIQDFHSFIRYINKAVCVGLCMVYYLICIIRLISDFFPNNVYLCICIHLIQIVIYGLKTTPNSECALNALAIDNPLEYARLYLDGTMKIWIDAEDSLEVW